MADSPIEVVDVLDFVHEPNEGGVELFIIARAPLEDTPVVRQLLREKIRFYLAQLNSEGFQAVFRHPPPEKTVIALTCEALPSPGLGDLLNAATTWVEEQNARLEVRVSPPYWSFLCNPERAATDSTIRAISGLRDVCNFAPSRKRQLAEPWARTCPACSTEFTSVQRTGVCTSCGLIFVVDESGKVIEAVDRSVERLDECELASRRIARHVQLLAREVITRDEFFDNALLAFIHMNDRYWPQCLMLIPDELARDLYTYASEHLLPVDFMPSPTPFMTDNRSEAAIQQKKRELRPKYVAFLKALGAE